MIIRRMQKEDIPGIAGLYRQFRGEESALEAMSRVFDRISNNESYLLLSAVAENRVIGSLQGIICLEMYGACRPFMLLENMIVDSSWRRKGIGKALVEKAENYAIENDCYQVILVTESTRRDAVSFYTSVGFIPGTHRGFKKKLIARNVGNGPHPAGCTLSD